MPLYFSQTRYKSFQRQLNFYGFKRIKEGKNKGMYWNELFRRDKPEMCCAVTRSNLACPNGFGSRHQDNGFEQYRLHPHALLVGSRNDCSPRDQTGHGEADQEVQEKWMHATGSEETNRLIKSTLATSPIEAKYSSPCTDGMKFGSVDKLATVHNVEVRETSLNNSEGPAHEEFRPMPPVGVIDLVKQLDDDLILEIIKTFGKQRSLQLKPPRYQ